MNRTKIVMNVNKIDMNLMREKLLLTHSKEEVEEMIESYKNFLIEAGTSNNPATPSKMADKVWHTHIMFMEKYMWDCMNAFGKILFHFPFRPQWNALNLVSSDCGNVDCSSTDCSNSDGRFSYEMKKNEVVITMKKPNFNLSDPKITDLERSKAFAHA